MRVVVARVILVGLVLGGHSPMPYIKSRKCLTLSCDLCCNKSMLKSPHANIVLLLRSLFKIGSRLSQNVDHFCPGALYTQLINRLLFF